MERFVYESEHDFLEKLKELKREGVNPKDIDILAPHPVLPAEEILDVAPSRVRQFALVGALLGAATGYLFTSLTSIDWRIVTGGKPIVSIVPYTVIGFELMVLFGALSSFLGFVITSRLPAVRTIISDDEFGDNFEIHVKR